MDNFTSLKPSIRDYFKSNIPNIELNYFIRHSCFSFHSSLSFYLYKAQAIGNRSVLTILGNMLRTTKLLSSINVRVELLLLQYTVTFLGILYTCGIFIVSSRVWYSLLRAFILVIFQQTEHCKIHCKIFHSVKVTLCTENRLFASLSF